MSENTEKKEVKKQTDLDLLNKMKACRADWLSFPWFWRFLSPHFSRRHIRSAAM